MAQSPDCLIQGALATLGSMHEVAKELAASDGAVDHHGGVAKGKILHAGIPQARAIVRNKAGKRVECGLPYLLSRLGGGMSLGRWSRGV